MIKKSTKVKPGYKKKMQREVEEIKKRKRRSNSKETKIDCQLWERGSKC